MPKYRFTRRRDILLGIGLSLTFSFKILPKSTEDRISANQTIIRWKTFDGSSYSINHKTGTRP